jgi:hypothetical protein
MDFASVFAKHDVAWLYVTVQQRFVMHVTQATKALYANCHLSIWCDRQQLPQASFQHRHDHPTQASPINVTVLYLQEGGMSPETVQTSELSVDCFTTKLYLDCHNDTRPAVCRLVNYTIGSSATLLANRVLLVLSDPSST